MTNKKIAVISGSRAEYGLLEPIIEQIYSRHQLQLYLTGGHLETVTGLTKDLVKYEATEISLQITGDSVGDCCLAIANGITKFSAAFLANRPDMMVCLGDRYEVFAACVAAHVHRIPIAHIHGGEDSGTMDKGFRNAISQLAGLHLAATEAARDRLMAAGCKNVRYVGALGCVPINLAKRKELELELGVRFEEYNILCVFHPSDDSKEFESVLEALDDFQGCVFFVEPNIDPGNAAIRARLKEWTAKAPDRRFVFANLPRPMFLGLLAESTMLVGNSSSGIIEAPTYKKTSIDIGTRQLGRQRAASVIHVRADANAIKQALADKLTLVWQAIGNPYYKEGTVGLIMEAFENGTEKQTTAKLESAGRQGVIYNQAVGR